MLQRKNRRATNWSAVILLLGLASGSGPSNAAFAQAPFPALRCENLLPKTSNAQSFAAFATEGSSVVASQHAYGPILTYHADPSLVGSLGPSVIIGTYNVENLFEHVPNADRPGVLQKEEEKRRGNARAIVAGKAGFQIVVEIEDIQALEKFNHVDLNDEFQPLLIEGNDARGIDVAILIRRTLPVDVQWRSYKETLAPDGSRVFSRDLPVGLVFDRGSDRSSTQKPRFIIAATHFKSQRVEPGQPDTTAERRRQQVLATVEIFKAVFKEIGAPVPVILAGDFNSDVHNSPEFQALFTAGFQDTLDMLPHPQQGAARKTQMYFPRNGPPESSQLDAILMIPNGASVVAGRVIPDTDSNGKPLPPPKTYQERETRPSDHLATAVEIVLPK